MPVQRAPGVVGDTIDGAAVLISPAGSHIVELNSLGSLVWSSIDGHRDSSALVDAVMDALAPGQVKREQVAADVGKFLEELSRLSLISQ